MTARISTSYRIKDGKITKRPTRLSTSAQIAKRKKAKVPRLATRAKAAACQQ